MIESTGTGGGMKLFCAGVGVNHPDITNASRVIKEGEIDLCKKNGVTEIIEIVIGNDGLTLAHSLEASNADFNQEQLYLALADEVPVNGQFVKNPFQKWSCLLYTSPSPRDATLSRMPSSA